jgi:hypothetical protein
MAKVKPIVGAEYDAHHTLNYGSHQKLHMKVAQQSLRDEAMQLDQRNI